MTRLRTAVLHAAWVGFFCGCSGGDGRVPVVVYSPHGPDILGELETAFEAARPDLDVRWFNLPTGEILTRVRGEAPNPRCDVWWGAPSSTFQRAADEGLLEPYRPTWVEHVPARYRDPGDRFTPHFVMPQVIVYNRERLAAVDAPAHWDDLVSPRFDDRVLIRAPLDSGSMRGAFSWLVAWKAAGADPAPGFQWLARLHRNTKAYVANPKELFEGIKRDRDDVVSIWNLADCIFQRDRYGYPFGIVVPDEGTPVVIDCIALVANPTRAAARADAARAFLEFVTTLDAGRTLMHDHGRLLVRDDVPAADLPPWRAEYAFTPLPVDPAFAARHEDAWMTRWDREVKPLPTD